MTTTPTTHPAEQPRTVHEPAAPALWLLRIEGAKNSLLLQRTLQRIAVPEVELLAARYAAGTGHTAIALTVRCTAARAQLSAAKLRKLVGVHAAELQAG